MPSNFTPYVDMIPEDVTPGDIYVGAIELARLSVPEFKVRQGTPEDALLQAGALMSHLAVSHFNRLPPRLMEGVARLLGVARDEGERGTVEATITLNQDVGISIPAGTKFYYQIISSNSTFQYVYENVNLIATSDWSGTPASTTVILKSSEVALHPTVTTGTELTSQSVIFAIDSVRAGQYGTAQAGTSTTITLASIASSTDDFYNGKNITITSGTGSSTTAVAITDYVGSTKVATVASWPSGTPDSTSKYTVDTTIVSGRSPEHGTTYLARTRAHIQGLSSALTKASHVSSSLLTTSTIVKRCKVYDLTDYTGAYPRLIAAPDDLGQVTIFTYGNNRQLTAAERLTTATDIANKSVAGLTVGCLDTDLIDVAIAIHVKYDSSYSTTVTEELLETTLLDYLSPLGFTGTDEGWTVGDIATLAGKSSAILYVESCVFSVVSGTSNTGTNYSALYQIDGNGNVEFLAKGVLPALTAANITATLTAVTLS